MMNLWWIPEVQDPEHPKRSELQKATQNFPLQEGTTGWILQCDQHPGLLEAGNTIELFPFTAGPTQADNT